MMKHEFEQIAGYEVSLDDYNNIIEPMYIAADIDKSEFVKLLSKERFEVKSSKSQERKDFENEIYSKINSYKSEILFFQNLIKSKRCLLDLEDDEEWIKVWKSDIRNYKDNIKLLKRQIAELKWVLG